jgi:hypothetical protein
VTRSLHTVQTSFIAGAIDASAQARTDAEMYAAAAGEIVNGLLLATGGVLSRWGSRHCFSLPAGNVLLAEFAFSLDQSYCAAFTAGRADFAFASDGAAAGSLTGCPWTAPMVPGLRFAQSGDVMWVFHPDMQTQVIRRTGASSWIIGAQVFDSITGTPTYRYADQAMTAAWNSGTSRLVFSGAHLVAGHVGTVVRVRDEAANAWRFGTITTVHSGTEASVTWTGAAPGTAAATRLWEEQAFSAVRGWARTGCLYEQRLWIGGSRDAGQAVWASRIGGYWDFDLGTAGDASAIAVTIAADGVRTIVDAVSGPQVTFLTEAGSFYVQQQLGRPITPTTVRVVRANAAGAAAVRAGSFDGGVLFVQANQRGVRDLIYSSDRENLRGETVSLAFTDSLGVVVDAAYASAQQDRPEQYAFFVNAAGRMAVFHSLREQRIAAWCEWRTQGSYRSVAYCGRSLFAAVVRSGTTRLERFDPALAFDAALPGLVEPLSVPHLSGLTAHGRNGDDYYGSGVVAGGGAVTLARRVSDPGAPPLTAEVGLAFDWLIRPLPPVVALGNGTSTNRVKRVVKTGLRLWQARTARVGGSTLTLLVDGFAVGTVAAPRTGWWRTTHLGASRTDDGEAMQRVIDRDVPMPVGILALEREVSY